MHIYKICNSVTFFVIFSYRYKGQAPDLIGKQDSVYEGMFLSCTGFCFF